MKTNIFVLSLLVLLSAGSRLHTSEHNKYEYQKNWKQIMQEYKGEQNIEKEHYEEQKRILPTYNETQQKAVGKEHYKNLELIKKRCEERLRANDRKRRKKLKEASKADEQRQANLLAKQPEDN